MREKAYIRNPKGSRGAGKFGNEQDLEDFEQEKRIQEWLEREGKSGAVELKHISSKGTARNTLLKAAISLDQQINVEDGTRTFADIIAGPPGRDLECGSDSDGTAEGPASAADRLDSEINLFFDAIGSNDGTKTWAIKTLKSAESLRKLRSLMKDEERSEISPISLESLRPLGSFKG